MKRFQEGRSAASMSAAVCSTLCPACELSSTGFFFFFFLSYFTQMLLFFVFSARFLMLTSASLFQ